MESPLAVANFFIQKSFDSGIEVTTMKAIKLVYISHGWHLGIYETPLINEAVQAWKYGPVVESVYQEFKNYGSKDITKLYETTTEKGTSVIPVIDDTTIPFLDRIWEVYKNYNGLQLSTLTHQKGTPWDIVWNEKGGCKKNSAIISNDIIQEHYKAKISDNATNAANKPN